MEIWRLLAFWLSRVLLTGIFPCAIAERTDEFVRAMELGFVSEEMAAAPDSAITWKQFCEMAGRMIETYDVSALPAWQEMTANALDTPMKRDGGMMSMLFVAKAVNLHNFNAGYPSVGMTDDLWVYATMDYPVFPFNTFIDLGGGVVDNNHVGPAYDYCLRRASLVSGKRLLDWDENNSLRFANDFTVRDAAQAIPRLRESAITIDQRMPNEEDAALLGKVEARKQKILNAQTDISYTGTTYYVSNDGDDQKDGQSPETAWATLDKVNEAGAGNMLLPGDAVLFERGGLWRGFINCAQGVTYSAYGEGEKPRIYGSEESGTGANKRELYHDENGVRIWKFYRDISETGNIVFNDGESYAIRVHAYFNGEQWVTSAVDSEPFDVVANLKNDLTFYSTFELSADEFRAYAEEQTSGNVASADAMDTNGPLYLRCDAGNPGEIYTDIEFHHRPAGMMGYIGLATPAGDNVIDNLCLKYTLMNGIAIYGTDRYHTDCNNNVIQNCEIGWTVGSQHELNRPTEDVMVCGESIVFKKENNVFQNNYMYQSACGGFVSEFVVGEWEGHTEALCRNNIIRGNIVEKCQDTFWFWSKATHKDSGQVFWENTLIEDNYALYGGYGWSNDERFVYPNQPLNTYHTQEDTWLFAVGGHPSEKQNMLVKNNVFYLSNGGWIIGTPDTWDQTYVITFSGNTYVQNDNRFIMTGGDRQSLMPYSLTAEAIKADLEFFLGDKEAVIFENSVAY